MGETFTSFLATGEQTGETFTLVDEAYGVEFVGPLPDGD